jgi:hypothetical protein
MSPSGIVRWKGVHREELRAPFPAAKRQSVKQNALGDLQVVSIAPSR